MKCPDCKIALKHVKLRYGKAHQCPQCKNGIWLKDEKGRWCHGTPFRHAEIGLKNKALAFAVAGVMLIAAVAVSHTDTSLLRAITIHIGF